MSRARVLLLALAGLALPGGPRARRLRRLGELARRRPAVVQAPAKIASPAVDDPDRAGSDDDAPDDHGGSDDDLPGKCRKPEHALDPDCDPRSATTTTPAARAPAGATATRAARAPGARRRLERPRLGRRRLASAGSRPRTDSLPASWRVFTPPGGALFPALPSLGGALRSTETRRGSHVHVHEDPARPGARRRLQRRRRAAASGRRRRLAAARPGRADDAHDETRIDHRADATTTATTTTGAETSAARATRPSTQRPALHGRRRRRTARGTTTTRPTTDSRRHGLDRELRPRERTTTITTDDDDAAAATAAATTTTTTRAATAAAMDDDR